MLNLLLTVGVGLGAILALARYNKSNRVFWMLLVSMLVGMAGGSIANGTHHSKKKPGITYVTPMQASTALTVDIDPAMLEDTYTELSVKPASQSYIIRDIMLGDRTSCSYNPESDVGNLEHINSS